MKKNQIIVLAGLGSLILLGGLGAYFLTNYSSYDNPGNQDQSQKQVKYSQDNPFRGGVQAALALGVPMKCTYQDDNVEYEGMVKGKKFKGDVKSEQGLAHIIVDNDCTYMWGDQLGQQGLKFCQTEEERQEMEDLANQEDSSQANDDSNQPEMPDNLVCYPAAVADSEFDLPQDVTFMSMDEMMQQVFSSALPQAQDDGDQMEIPAEVRQQMMQLPTGM